MQADELKQAVRALASGQGFELCRITQPEIHPKHLAALDSWVEQGMQGDMAWMADEERLARRRNPAGMLQGVRTVITVAMRHSPPGYTLDEALAASDRGVISAYAHGDDYHDIMKPRLKALARDLDALLGTLEQRVYVDTAPVLEHALAEDSGLGWQGKHSLTLNRHLGSWFLLGELFTTAHIEPDEQASFHCGSCTACMHACPTQAIVAPFVVDARRCISYLSIEHKGFIPRALRPLMGNRIYGCDDCQMVCPWNSDAGNLLHDSLSPRGENCLPELASLLVLDDASFRKLFAKSPVKRVGRDRFLRNCCIAAGNSGDRTLLAMLWQLARDDAALVRGHAVWALGMLGGAQDAVTMRVDLAAMMRLEPDGEVREEIDLTINELKEKT